jgi:hypothetical protein
MVVEIPDTLRKRWRIANVKGEALEEFWDELRSMSSWRRHR